jgi:hypothetical protein
VLTEVIRLALGEYSATTVRNMAVYAMTQPPPLPWVLLPLAPASIGVEGEGSGSGASEVMVKSEVKKSIVVYVVCESRDAVKLSEAERIVHALLLYLVWLRSTIARADEDRV